MYISTLDLCAGYHHIPLDESSIPKTGFTSPFGKYEYIKVPSGVMQAPAYFQEFMTDVLRDFFYHHLSRWHHYLQQNGRGTP